MLLRTKSNGSVVKKKKGVMWDEENLQYNDEHRDATMKIDEPPTPYNYMSTSSDNDDEGDDDVIEARAVPAAADEQSSPTEIVPPPPKKHLGVRIDDSGASFMSQVTDVLAGMKVDSSGCGRPAVMGAHSDDEPEKEKDEKFLEHRKQHYNIGNLLKKRWSDDDGLEEADQGMEDEE